MFESLQLALSPGLHQNLARHSARSSLVRPVQPQASIHASHLPSHFTTYRHYSLLNPLHIPTTTHAETTTQAQSATAPRQSIESSSIDPISVFWLRPSGCFSNPSRKFADEREFGHNRPLRVGQALEATAIYHYHPAQWQLRLRYSQIP